MLRARGHMRCGSRVKGVSIIGFDGLCTYETVPFSQADARRPRRDGRSRGEGRRSDRRRQGRTYGTVQRLPGLVAEGVERFGDIDIVIANAGIGINGAPFWEVPEADFKDVIDVNLTGVWHTVFSCDAVDPRGAKGGSIIITSSAAAIKAAPNVVPLYGIEDGRDRNDALDGERPRSPPGPHQRGVSHERDYRLLVQRPALPPLPPRSRASGPQDDVRPVMAQMHPLGEPWIDTDDVSAAVAYLASDEASCSVTGIVLPVDTRAVDQVLTVHEFLLAVALEGDQAASCICRAARCLTKILRSSKPWLTPGTTAESPATSSMTSSSRTSWIRPSSTKM